MTTLPLPQWPTSLVIELYACRWHIEVLFKRIKQVLDLHTLRCETPETAQAMIAARLFAWLLVEQDLEGLRRQLADGEPFAVALSSWRLAHLAFASLHQVVKGWYSPQQLRAALASVSPTLPGASPASLARTPTSPPLSLALGLGC